MENSLYYSKYIKPIKLEERLLDLKEEMDKNIKIFTNELVYNGDVGLAQLKIFEKYYKNCTINILFDVNLNNCNLKKIPIRFGYVKGCFNIAYNQITSLKNCPKKVNGYFDCSSNLLKTLKNCPKNVGEYFVCGNNTFKFTKPLVEKHCVVTGPILYDKKSKRDEFTLFAYQFRRNLNRTKSFNLNLETINDFESLIN